MPGTGARGGACGWYNWWSRSGSPSGSYFRGRGFAGTRFGRGRASGGLTSSVDRHSNN